LRSLQRLNGRDLLPSESYLYLDWPELRLGDRALDRADGALLRGSLRRIRGGGVLCRRTCGCVSRMGEHGRTRLARRCVGEDADGSGDCSSENEERFLIHEQRFAGEDE